MRLYSSWTAVIILFLIWMHGIGQAQSSHYFVKKINVEGNKKTKTYILLREIEFSEGDSIYSPKIDELINQSKKNLVNTNLFNQVNIKYLVEENIVVINIEVAERFYIVPVPEILLADRSFNEWLYDRGRDFRRISYGLNFRHYNLTGNMDQLRLRVLFGFVPYFELSYGKPYIDKRRRIGIGIGAFYSAQRSLAYNTFNDKLAFINSEETNRKRKGGFFELRLRNALYNFHSIGVGFTNYTISDTLASLNDYYLGKGVLSKNITSFNYEYRFDKRDNRQYPLTGNAYSAEIQGYLGKNLNHWNLSLVQAKYMKLAKKVYFEESVRTKLSIPRSQLFPLIRGLGYQKNLVRGYELYAIDGQNFGLLRSTLKYALIKKAYDLQNRIPLKKFSYVPLGVYPNTFFDIGYIRNFYPERNNTLLGNKLIYGYGLGLDVATLYNSNLKLFFTRNSIKENGVFFSFSNDF
ncbi:MAG: POTRA domain-containing protein [Leadbetterella sp.]